ncbi:hypothetical protein ABGB18_45730 [Nonomuraea sp. B12E4]|uniref:hypothetical protein n=1 Tax=Nonomuraea sp. B12E4 TaxID=3153564 RepID=UPI00325D29C2
MNEADRDLDHFSLLMSRVEKLRNVEAGKPSLQRIETVSLDLLAERPEDKGWLRALPKSTVSDLINRRSKKLPDYMLLRTFVEVCHRIATRSGIPIDPIEDLAKEFLVLWQKAQAEELNRTSAAKHRRTPPNSGRAPAGRHPQGDVLESAPGEASSWKPAPTTLRVPLHWGRLGSLRLRLADEGDPKAAYELAVLLACEACGKGDSVKDQGEAKHWRFQAAFWHGKAIGVIPAAGELQLHGRQLVKSAEFLAREYTAAGKPSASFFWKAVRQAELSLQRKRLVTSGTPNPDEHKKQADAVLPVLNEG